MLHMARVPVWFQQHFTRNIPIWQVVMPKRLPFHFSTTLAFLCLVPAVRDLSGALNTAGEWQQAMTAEVHRQLLKSQLPSLMREAKADGPSESKPQLDMLWPSQWSALRHARPMYVVCESGQAKTLGHDSAHHVSGASITTGCPHQHGGPN